MVAQLRLVGAASLPLVTRQGTCIDLDVGTVVTVRVAELNCFLRSHTHCLIVEVLSILRFDFPVREMLSATGARFVGAIITSHRLLLLSISAAQAVQENGNSQQNEHIFRFQHHRSSLPDISTSLQRVRAVRATQSAAAKIFLASCVWLRTTAPYVSQTAK